MGNEPYEEWIKRNTYIRSIAPNGRIATRNAWLSAASSMFVLIMATVCVGSTTCAISTTRTSGARNAARRLTLTGASTIVATRYCGGSMTCNYYCPRHRGADAFMDAKEPAYVYPYAFVGGNRLNYPTTSWKP